MAPSPYIELHAHSAFSFLDGASTPLELAGSAARLGYEAMALTDHDGISHPYRVCGCRYIGGVGVCVGAYDHLHMGRGGMDHGSDVQLVGGLVRQASQRRYGTHAKIRRGARSDELLVDFDEFSARIDMTPLGCETVRDERDGDDPSSARAVLIYVAGGEVIDADGATELRPGSYVVTGKLFAFGGPPGWKGTIDIH